MLPHMANTDKRKETQIPKLYKQAGRCRAYDDRGRICGAPANYIDEQRGMARVRRSLPESEVNACQFCGETFIARNCWNLHTQGPATCGKRECQRKRKSQLQKQRRSAARGEATSIDIASAPKRGSWRDEHQCTFVMAGGCGAERSRLEQQNEAVQAAR